MRILSLGAGVQSSTLALLAAAGEVGPMPDAAIFADTGWEPAAVYQQLAWLSEPGRLPFPVHVVRAGNIRDGILSRRNTSGGSYSAIPYYTNDPTGQAGMGRRQCTSEYKLVPIRRRCRELLGKSPTDYIRKGSIEMWIGISVDEAHRMKPGRPGWIVNRWPLIERYLSRRGCLAWLEAHGFPEPPRSSCIGCPFNRDSGWLEMRRKAPTEFADAVAVDTAMRADGNPVERYMHNSRLPLAEAVDRAEREKRAQPDLFGNEVRASVGSSMIHFCAEPSCPTLIARGRRCLVHGAAKERARPNVDIRRWYRTPAWRALRRQVITDAAHTCASCGKVAAALEVDHIRKHDGDRGLFWSRANVQALCRRCHQTKTQRGE